MMQAAEPRTIRKSLSPLDADAYLEGLHALAGEINRAMDAMVAGQVHVLEDSVKSQTAACARLADLAHRSAVRQSTPGAPPSPSLDPDMALRIDGAARSLKILNDRYAALLKHSSDTVRMLTSLFRTYNGPSHQAAIPAAVCTWSCEV